MSTHNITFSILKKKTQERVRNSRGERAISVRATEGLLYSDFEENHEGHKSLDEQIRVTFPC